MELVDMEQQRGKCSDSAAAWKKLSKLSSVEKVAIM